MLILENSSKKPILYRWVLWCGKVPDPSCTRISSYSCPERPECMGKGIDLECLSRACPSIVLYNVVARSLSCSDVRGAGVQISTRCSAGIQGRCTAVRSAGTPVPLSSSRRRSSRRGKKKTGTKDNSRSLSRTLPSSLFIAGSEQPSPRCSPMMISVAHLFCSPGSFLCRN